MRIPENLVQEIREKVNIVDIVGDYVALEKKGKNYFGCCPFHNEDTPSFSVTEEKQIFYCFGCHEGGNVYNFLMKHEGLSFTEAVIKIAEFANVSVNTYAQALEQERRKQDSNAEYYDLNTYVTDFYNYMLKTDKGIAGRKYLASRGIGESEIKKFRIGFAPNEQLLSKLLVEKNLSLKVATELGVIFENSSLTDYLDAFRNRIIFPITNYQGQVVAFTGRLIAPNADFPKYYHSPESKIFHKRETLYNYSNAEVSIRRKRHVYICEGIFDVIVLAQAGVENVIATLGTAITQEQINFLKRKKITMTFLFDNDNAGKKASIRALQLALELQATADVVTFWEYAEKDLAEIAESFSVERLKSIIDKKITTFDYFIQYYEQNLNLANNDERQQFAQKILAVLEYSNLATKGFYYDKIKEKTNYNDAVLADLLKNVQTNQKNVPIVNPQQQSPKQFTDYRPQIKTRKLSKQEQCEILIVKGICSGGAFVQEYQLYPVFSQNKLFRRIIYEVLEMYRIHKMVDISYLYEKLSPEEAQYMTKAIHREEPMDIEIFKTLLKNLKDTSEFQYHRSASRKADLDAEQKKILVQSFLDYRKDKNK